MEASGQLNAPAALPPRKELSISIAYGAGRAPGPVWTLLRIEISLIMCNELESV
jgi:hypothetical protein